MEQNRAQVRTQSQNNPLENPHIFLAILQLGNMGNLLRRLESKAKKFRGRAIPTSHRLAVWDSVKSIVNLGGQEAFRVKLQHLGLRKLLRIKSPSPHAILESGGADQRNHEEKIPKARDRIQNTLNPPQSLFLASLPGGET